MKSTSSEGASGQLPGFGPGRFETRVNRQAMLEAALLELGSDWIVLADVHIESPMSSFATDYLLIHPELGIALLGRAGRSAPAARSVASFRSFLRERGFDAFYPGYLPIVQVDADVPDSLALGRRIVAAFAAALRLTINDHDWGEAVGDVLTVPHQDRTTPAPDKRHAPIVTKTAARQVPADDATEAKSPARPLGFAKPPDLEKALDVAKTPHPARAPDDDPEPHRRVEKPRHAPAPAGPRAERANGIVSGSAFRAGGARLGSVLGALILLGALVVWLLPSGTATDSVSLSLPSGAAIPAADTEQRNLSGPVPFPAAIRAPAPDAKVAIDEEHAETERSPTPAETTPASVFARPEEPIDAPRIASPASVRVSPPPAAHPEMTASRRSRQGGADSPHIAVAPGETPRYVWERRLAAARPSRAALSPRTVRGDIAPPIDAADLPPLDPTPPSAPQP